MLDFIRKVVSSGTNQRHQKIPFSPVQTEITAENLEVDGRIPNALSQRLAAGGPLLNQITMPLSGMTQIHDMSITKNDAIILDLSGERGFDCGRTKPPRRPVWL